MFEDGFDALIWTVILLITGTVLIASIVEGNETDKFQTICDFQKGEFWKGSDTALCLKFSDDRKSAVVLMKKEK